MAVNLAIGPSSIFSARATEGGSAQVHIFRSFCHATEVDEGLKSPGSDLAEMSRVNDVSGFMDCQSLNEQGESCSCHHQSHGS
jgi:hypothetical protein